jgi:predicted dehydrogenase
VLAAAAPMVISSRVLGLNYTAAPSNRVTLGFIGVGNHGTEYNLRSHLELDDAHVVAVCDVFKSRAENARRVVDQKYGTSDCKTYGDFRDVLARKDIDAVVICTPDHWHVPISMMAVEAGKDVQCEKPTLTIEEGRQLVEAVAKHKRVYRVGLEDRSILYYQRMCEIVRNGGIGKLQRMFVKLPAGENFPKEEAAPVPADLNWQMWLGPAPFHPYTPNRTGLQNWRNIRDYSGGKFSDWGAHLLDTAQIANFAEKSGPVEVEGEGKIPANSMTTMPVEYKVRYRYANGVEMLVESGAVAMRFEGTDGWVGNDGWRGPLKASSEEILRQKYPAETNKMWPVQPPEHRNFIDCVKSRKDPSYTSEDGQRLSTVMHIGNIAIELGRKLKWDPQTESFVDDDAANKLRRRESRDWKSLV